MVSKAEAFDLPAAIADATGSYSRLSPLPVFITVYPMVHW
jgi:hypothetical protein